MFYDNFIRICAERKESPSGVAKKIGLSNAAASGWKKGKQPSEVTLEKLSQYFDVPISELIESQKEKPSAHMGEELGDDKQKLLEMVKDMSDEEMSLLFDRIEKIKESRI